MNHQGTDGEFRGVTGGEGQERVEGKTRRGTNWWYSDLLLRWESLSVYHVEDLSFLSPKETGEGESREVRELISDLTYNGRI